MTTSRPNLIPPSTRRRTLSRKPERSSAECAARKPISQGRPVFLIEVSGDAPVPPSKPAMVITSAPAFATPAAMIPTPAPETSFTPILRDRIHGAQVVNQLSQIFDAVNVVMRRRGNQRHPRNGVAQARDVGVYFDGGKLAAFSGLRALRHFDFEFVGTRQIFGGHAESRRSNLLHAICGFGFEAINTGIFAAFSRVAARAETIHGDGQSTMRFRTERT